MHYSNTDAGVGGMSLREVVMWLLASFEESSSGKFSTTGVAVAVFRNLGTK
jgi:hypothetical protein